MLAFPEMIAPAAKEAGIVVPADLSNFDPIEYPHWAVFSAMQLGAPMPHPSVHWENAKVVAELSKEEVMVITAEQLKEKGFQIGYSK